MKQHLLLMCGLASRQQQQLSTLRSSVSRVSLNYSGTFLWRINDVQTKIAEARIKEGFELISAPFYTSQYGYKLQVCLISLSAQLLFFPVVAREPTKSSLNFSAFFSYTVKFFS